MAEKLPVRDALLSFAAQEPLRAALFLSYSFDGRWFEDAIVADLCDRPIATMLVIRDRNAITSEAPSVRYRKTNACASAVFHPKLALLVTDNSARAVISSANLTRGGFERQRELGRVFDLSPSANEDYNLIASLVEYLQHGIAKEIRGNAAQDLANIVSALREVVHQYKAPKIATPHVLLHNYIEPIWTQVIKQLPHRVLRRAVIVSPFFESDRQHPEDPVLGPQDTSIFARMLFEDFEYEPPKDESPVRVFFRQSENCTELPIRKLMELGNRLDFFAQDEREQRLHAKLVLLEGASGKGREPFLMALHGSPNFTTAGLINRPPNGNSELAVLTSLPTKKRSFDQAIRVLELERGFNHVEDLVSLQSIDLGAPPRLLAQGVADATYSIDQGTVTVSLIQVAPPGARIRISLQCDGTWVAIGEADASDAIDIPIPVTGMIEVDDKTRLLALRGTTIRIELIGANGDLLESDSAPINVETPEEFCGLTRVGSALLTLDERIARSGLGVPPTYREQQRWLETRKTQEATGENPTVINHQADLDRFYRNIHQGLRGILFRVKATPGSEFSLRRSLDELTRWATEAATSDEHNLSRECRLFLVDRLLRSAHDIVKGSPPTIKARLPIIALELTIADRLSQVTSWLKQIDGSALSSYATGSQAYVRQILAICKNGASR